MNKPFCIFEHGTLKFILKFSIPLLNYTCINFYLTASKIHITSEVNDELAIIGGFKTELRGLIDVKVSFFVICGR